MTDNVVEAAVRPGREAELFSAHFSAFVDGLASEAEIVASLSDAPYVMMSSAPFVDHEVKVVTFQTGEAARAFERGWARARQTLDVAAAPAE